MEQKLTKTEQRLLDLFCTKRNEDGRVQTFTLPEAKAAWSLSRKGLVTAEYTEQHGTRLVKGSFGRFNGSESYVSGAVNVRLIK